MAEDIFHCPNKIVECKCLCHENILILLHFIFYAWQETSFFAFSLIFLGLYFSRFVFIFTRYVSWISGLLTTINKYSVQLSDICMVLCLWKKLPSKNLASGWRSTFINTFKKVATYSSNSITFSKNYSATLTRLKRHTKPLISRSTDNHKTFFVINLISNICNKTAFRFIEKNRKNT